MTQEELNKYGNLLKKHCISGQQELKWAYDVLLLKPTLELNALQISREGEGSGVINRMRGSLSWILSGECDQNRMKKTNI